MLGNDRFGTTAVLAGFYFLPLLTWAATSANAETIVFEIPGAVDILGITVNSSGDLTGWFEDANFDRHCFVWSSAVGVTTFDIPDGPVCTSVGIDDRGSVAGSYIASRRKEGGFVRAPDGTITTFRGPKGERSIQPQGSSLNGFVAGDVVPGGEYWLPKGFIRDRRRHLFTFSVPGSDYAIATCTNDSPTVAGYWGTGGNGGAFVRSSDGTIATFLEGSNPYPTHINNQDQIVGYFSSGSELDGFLRAGNGSIVTFAVAGAKTTSPASINAAGTVVGTTYDGVNYRGFIRATDGTITTYAPPNAINAFLDTINDVGEMAGTYQDAEGQAHVFETIP
jgi:hypothetical protein